MKIAEYFKNLAPKYLLIASANWLSKGITALLNLFSVGILSSSLSEQDYTLFIVLTGLQSWFILSDFGIGSSIQNFISESRATNKSEKEFIATGNTLLLGLALTFFLLIVLASYFMAPAYLNAFHQYTDSEKINLFILGASLLLFTNTFEVVYKFFYAQGRGHNAIFIYTIGRVLSFVGIWILYKWQLTTSITTFIIVYQMPIVIMPFFSFLTFVKKHNLSLNIKLSDTYVKILKRGIGFWVFTFMMYIPFQFDYYLIATYLPNEDVIIYNLFKRIFEIGTFIYGAVLVSLWPVCTELLVKKEWEGMISKIKKIILGGLAFISLFILGLFLFSDLIISTLLKDLQIQVQWGFILFFGFYFILRVWIDTFTMVLQSINKFKILWINFSIIALFSVILEIILVKPFGLYGIVAALIIPLLLSAVWQLPLYLKSLKHRYSNQ